MKHDDECEKLPDFYICHCYKRERLARNVIELPRLVVDWPACSGCGNTVHHDGNSLRCDRCHVIWGSGAHDGDLAERFWDEHNVPGETLEDMRAKWLARKKPEPSA